jgi:allantoicase
MAASDEFFAPKDRLIAASAPVWREGEYTDRGKWMDGWETRRRRDILPGEPGFEAAHDWCIVRLGARGVISAVDVDTTHFKGNYPESCAIDACVMPVAAAISELQHARWQPAVARSPLNGDAHNEFTVDGVTATHVRLQIFPDGGVARLRAYGDVAPDWDELTQHGEIDLAAAIHGGRVVDSSDMFFGSRNNLIMPGPSLGMSDGWETKRRRTQGQDWTIVRLGRPGTITRVEVDTHHFKGNAPAACSLDACTSDAPGDWTRLLPRTPLMPDRLHRFDAGLAAIAGARYVRLTIFPDGGIARLRVFGTL